MNYTDVPIWEKYTLTIEEASKYFRIGEKKLRKLAEENPTANWLIMNEMCIRDRYRIFVKLTIKYKNNGMASITTPLFDCLNLVLFSQRSP